MFVRALSAIRPSTKTSCAVAIYASILFWCGSTSAQVRQDKLFLDDGTGQLLVLRKASGGSTWTFTFPSDPGASGQVLTFGNGGQGVWNNIESLLPTQSGNAGLFLKTDGSTLSWASPGASAWSNTTGKIYPTTLTDKIGIGTSTPNYQLHVNNASSVAAYAQFTNASTGTASTDGLQLGVDASGGGVLRYGENGIFSIDALGGTGIQMDAAGRIAVGGAATVGYNFLAYGANPSIAVNSSGITIGDVFGNSFANYFYVDFETSPRFLFMGADIGIGTTIPSEVLDIASGNVRISAANDYKYASAKTHYYSVAGADFSPENGAQFNRGFIGGNIYAADGTATSTGYFIAPVHLPDGATVTSVIYYVVDNDGTYNPQTGQLFRNDASTGTSYGNLTAMATVVAPAITNSTLIQSSTTSTITAAVIDNQNYSYYLRWGTQQANSNIRLSRVLISYTVTKVD